MSLSRTLWGVGLGWMVIACSTGNAPLVNKILSYKLFVPLSRMCYCMYLLNPLLVALTTFMTEQPRHMDIISTVMNLFGTTT